MGTFEPRHFKFLSERSRVHRNCVDMHAGVALFRPIIPLGRNEQKGVSAGGLC